MVLRDLREDGQEVDNDEILAIHEATLDILQGCGVKVLSGRLLEMLRDRGLEKANHNLYPQHALFCSGYHVGYFFSGSDPGEPPPGI